MFLSFFLTFLIPVSAIADNGRWNTIIGDDQPVQSVPSTPTTGGTWSPVVDPQAVGQTGSEDGSLSDFWAHLARTAPRPTLQIPAPTARKSQAYIMAGDLSSTKAWLVDIFNSFTGMFSSGPPAEATAIEWIAGIVTQARQSLQRVGYTSANIRTDLRATAEDLKTALENPKLGALIWIGHGQVGKIIDTTANSTTGIISESPVRRWALDFLKSKNIYRLPSSYPPGSRMYLAMARIQDRAHFGLDYFYSHSCLTMQDPSLAAAMLSGAGRYEGYIESKLAYVAVLTPAVSNTLNQEIPDVHSLMVVPDVKGLTKQQARGDLQRAGFSVQEFEDRPDRFMAGQVYSQDPYEGTLLDKYRSDKTVKIYVYKTADDNTGQGGDENKYMIWINKFGGAGRIHAGTVSRFKGKKKYADEWLAGTSQDYLEKEDISGGIRHENLEEAKKSACAKTSNRRKSRIPGWGSVPVGDMNGNTYYINGLDCTIP